MRPALLVVPALVAALAAGCGGSTKTVTRTAPAQTVTVTPAPARETAFDWELVSAQLLNGCSRA